MAYDEDLAARVRDLLTGEEGLTEQRMFGGLAFLVRGNMAVAVGGHGGLLVRSDPDRAEDLRDGDRVAPMVMRGREMRGWLRVAPDVVREPAELERWVSRGADHARVLPPKPAASRRRSG